MELYSDAGIIIPDNIYAVYPTSNENLYLCNLDNGVGLYNIQSKQFIWTNADYPWVGQVGKENALLFSTWDHGLDDYPEQQYRIIRISDGQLLHSFNLEYYDCMNYFNDENLFIVSETMDGDFAIHKYVNGIEVRMIELDDRIERITGSSQFLIFITNYSMVIDDSNLGPIHYTEGSYRFTQISDDESILAVSLHEYGDIAFYDLDDFQEIGRIHANGSTFAMDLSQNLIFVVNDEVISIYDMATGNNIQNIQATKSISDIHISGKYLVVNEYIPSPLTRNNFIHFYIKKGDIVDVEDLFGDVKNAAKQ